MSGAIPPARGGALVTGAAKRVGRALAEALAADGFAVAVHCNSSTDEADAVVAGIRAAGGRAATVRADLADAEAVDGLVDAAVAAVGPLDVLVNNASLFERDEAPTLTVERFDRHMAVNARAPLFLARAFAAQVRPQTMAAGAAVVINIADQKLWNLNPDFLSYTISKVALEGVTHALAMALAPVRVVGVAPGLTLRSGAQTDEGFARAHAQTVLGRGNDVADLVHAVRYLIGARAVTGHTILVDGGQHLTRRGRDVMFEVK